jgi:hypothetical protein
MYDVNWNQYLCFIFITTTQIELFQRYFTRKIATFAQKIYVNFKKNPIKPALRWVFLGGFFRRFFFGFIRRFFFGFIRRVFLGGLPTLLLILYITGIHKGLKTWSYMKVAMLAGIIATESIFASQMLSAALHRTTWRICY